MLFLSEKFFIETSERAISSLKKCSYCQVNVWAGLHYENKYSCYKCEDNFRHYFDITPTIYLLLKTIFNEYCDIAKYTVLLYLNIRLTNCK